MAKMLLKHLGIGKHQKSGGSGSHRSDYNAQKSNSVQELLPKSPTRYQSSVSLSTSANDYDTQSLKLYIESGGQHHPHQRSDRSHSHDHRSCVSNSSCGVRHKDPGSLSPKGNSDGYQTTLAGTCLTEERDSLEMTPDPSFEQSLSSQTSTPPRLLDEYCDPLDLKKLLAESAELLGACATTTEDDYSVPYEVKKILRGIRNKGQIGVNGKISDGSGKLRMNGSSESSNVAEANGYQIEVEDGYDEPYEWTAKLGSVLTSETLLTNGNDKRLTPLMTPKRMKKNCNQGVVDSEPKDAVNSLDESEVKAESEDDAFLSPQQLTPDDGETVRFDGTKESGVVSGSDSGKRDTLLTPDRHSRLCSSDSSSGGSLIVTEIPQFIDLEPFDCVIVLPPTTEIPEGAAQLGEIQEDEAELGSIKSELHSEGAHSTDCSDCDVGFKDDFQCSSSTTETDNKNKLELELATNANTETLSNNLLSSYIQKKCNHAKQLHRTNKLSSTKTGSCVNSKSIHPIVLSPSPKINPEIALENQSWYHGPIGRVEAEELLEPHKEGSFLVRMSESNKLDFSLSLKSIRGFLHMKIVNEDGKYILGQFSQPFDSIPHMIEFYCLSKLPIKGNENISLIYPLATELL